ETALPVERAVAASAVAPDFCEDRHHIGIEAGWRGRIRALDKRGGRSAQAAVRCANDSAAISLGCDDSSLIDAGNGGFFRSELCTACDVFFRSVRITRGGDQRLLRAFTEQQRICGIDR